MNNSISQSARLIFAKATLTADSYQFKVFAEDDGRYGSSEISIQINSPPIGSCTSNPTSGIEYQTQFKIVCHFEDEDQPLQYSLQQNNQYIWTSMSESFIVRLNAGGIVKIKITDALGAFELTSLTIQLEAIKNDSTITDVYNFLNPINGSSFTSIVKSGDISTAIVMAKSAINLISTLNYTAKHKIISEILEIIMQLELNRFEEIPPIAELLLAIIEINITDHQLSNKLSQQLYTISSAILDVSEEFEFFHYDELEIVLISIVQTIQNIIFNVDKINYINDYDTIEPDQYPFEENYPLYGEFDPGVFFKLENLLNSTNNIYSSIEKLAAGFVSFIEPEEPEIKIFYGDILLRTFSSDSNFVNVNSNRTKLVIPKVSGKINIFCVFFIENLFWWYPESNVKNSEHIIFQKTYRNLRTVC